MAKHFVANSLGRIIDRAIQVHGTLGYSARICDYSVLPAAPKLNVFRRESAPQQSTSRDIATNPPSEEAGTGTISVTRQIRPDLRTGSGNQDHAHLGVTRALGQG